METRPERHGGHGHNGLFRKRDECAQAPGALRPLPGAGHGASGRHAVVGRPRELYHGRQRRRGPVRQGLARRGDQRVGHQARIRRHGHAGARAHVPLHHRPRCGGLGQFDRPRRRLVPGMLFEPATQSHHAQQRIFRRRRQRGPVQSRHPGIWRLVPRIPLPQRGTYRNHARQRRAEGGRQYGARLERVFELRANRSSGRRPRAKASSTSTAAQARCCSPPPRTKTHTDAAQPPHEEEGTRPGPFLLSLECEAAVSPRPVGIPHGARRRSGRDNPIPPCRTARTPKPGPTADERKGKDSPRN